MADKPKEETISPSVVSSGPKPQLLVVDHHSDVFYEPEPAFVTKYGMKVYYFPKRRQPKTSQ